MDGFILTRPPGIVCFAVAALSSIALIALVTTLSTSILDDTSMHGCGLAAACLDILAFASLVGFMLVRTLKPQAWHKPADSKAWIPSLALGLLTLLAGILSLVVLIWTAANQHVLEQGPLHRHIWGLLGPAIGFWILFVVAHSIFFALIVWESKKRVTITAPVQMSQDDYVTANEDKRSSYLLGILNPPPPPVLPLNTPRSPTSLQPSPRSSIRNSIQHILQPMTSRSRLIRQSSFQSEKSGYSERPVSASNRPEDAFETWVVETNFDDRPSTPPPSRRQRLETIPGSRPVSPGKPLDGPFPDQESPADMPLPESPLASPLASPAVDDHFFTPPLSSSAFGPRIEPLRPSSARSRRPSYSDQFHIHPLFRTDNPAPPPAASPGTIVTASPYGGLVMTDTERAYTLARPPSRTSVTTANSGFRGGQYLSPKSSRTTMRGGTVGEDYFARGSMDRVPRPSFEKVPRGSFDRVPRTSFDRLPRTSFDRVPRSSEDRVIRSSEDRGQQDYMGTPTVPEPLFTPTPRNVS